MELEDAERILSFDLKFLSPGDAEMAIKKLVEQGWIVQDDEEILTPALTLHNVEKTPLSWVPRPRLLNPVSFTGVGTETVLTSVEVEPNIDQSQQSKIIENPNEDGLKNQSSDPRVAKEGYYSDLLQEKPGFQKRRYQGGNKGKIKPWNRVQPGYVWH